MSEMKLFKHTAPNGFTTEHSFSDLTCERRVYSNPITGLVRILLEKGFLSPSEVLDALGLSGEYEVLEPKYRHVEVGFKTDDDGVLREYRKS